MFLEVSKAIKQDRINKKMSYKEYAKILGVSPSTVRKWEKGVNTPGDRSTFMLRAKHNLDIGEIRRNCMY